MKDNNDKYFGFGDDTIAKAISISFSLWNQRSGENSNVYPYPILLNLLNTYTFLNLTQVMKLSM